MMIRHLTLKRILRVETNTGCVDVTQDHSLLLEDGTKITPMQLIPGVTKLLHHDLPPYQKTLGDGDGKIIMANECWKIPHTQDQNSNLVTRVTDLGVIRGYVYDIETKNHHFSAGIGRMVVQEH